MVYEAKVMAAGENLFTPVQLSTSGSDAPPS
jgi:hypothetical protein